MNFKGLTGKITKNINTVGLLGGAAVALTAAGQGQNLLTVLEGVLDQALSDPHFPNFDNVKYDLLNRSGIMHKPLMDMVKLALIGELASMVGIAPKYANMAKKFGWNAAKAVVGTDIVLRATYWHSPNTGTPTSTESNFANAPQIGSYGY